MNKKLFFITTIIYFSFHALFSFLRMMFSWDIIIATKPISTWVSGILFIFSMLMIYWAIKSKSDKKIEEGKETAIEEEERAENTN